MIDTVSPRYKPSQHAVQSFVQKTVDLLFQDVNLLVADLLPAGPRGPQDVRPRGADGIRLPTAGRA